MFIVRPTSKLLRGGYLGGAFISFSLVGSVALGEGFDIWPQPAGTPSAGFLDDAENLTSSSFTDPLPVHAALWVQIHQDSVVSQDGYRESFSTLAQKSDRFSIESEKNENGTITYAAEKLKGPQARVYVLKDAPALNDEDKNLVVTVDDLNDGLKIRPQGNLTLKLGESLSFAFNGFSSKPTVLVREKNILNWNTDRSKLTSLRAGSSEIIIVSGEKFAIANVSVKAAAPSIAVAGLKVPESLVELPASDLNQMKLGSFAAETELAQVEPTPGQDRAQTTISSQEDSWEFSTPKKKQELKDLRLKFVDDRTDIRQKQYFPASNLVVHVSGVGGKFVTDAGGWTLIKAVPHHSRLLISYSDPNGKILPGIAEVYVRDASEGRKKTKEIRKFVHVRRSFSFDYVAQIAGVTPRADLASMCGQVFLKGYSHGPSAHVALSTDSKLEKIVYFNEFGLPDRRLGETSSNGRYCLLNVEPGALALHFFVASRHAETAILPMEKGFHAEEKFYFSPNKDNHAKIAVASLSKATEQLSSDPLAADALRKVSEATITPAGFGEALYSQQPGLFASEKSFTTLNHRGYFVNEGGDYENSVTMTNEQMLSSDSHFNHLVPLVPRGFLDDMSVYAQVTQEDELGSVLINQYKFAEQSADPVHIRLVDMYGRDVGHSWSFADGQNTAKSLFFNVPPGYYSVIASTPSGEWLGSDTVVVYSDTLSIGQIGGDSHIQGPPAAEELDDKDQENPDLYSFNQNYTNTGQFLPQ